MERLARSDWAPGGGDVRTAFLKQGGIRALKLALGRVIEQECSAHGPGDYQELYADSLIVVALPRGLAAALRSEIDTLAQDLAHAAETHGRMRGRVFRLELAPPHAGDEILVQSAPAWAAGMAVTDLPSEAEGEVDSERTLPDAGDLAAARATGSAGSAGSAAAPPLSSDRTLAVDEESLSAAGWRRGRWALASLDEGDHHPVRIYPLADPVTTVGRSATRAELNPTIALEDAPDFISRRQLALEWEERNGSPGFVVYNLGRPVISLLTEGAEQLPGAQVGSGPLELRKLGNPYAIWVRPGTAFRVGHRGPVLAVLDLTTPRSDPDATVQEASGEGASAWDAERTMPEQ